MCAITGKHNSQPVQKDQASNPVLTIKQISCEEKYEGEYCKLFIFFFTLKKKIETCFLLMHQWTRNLERIVKSILLIKVY